MELLENLLAGALVLAGLLIVAGNYFRQIKNFMNRKKKDVGWNSPLPFMGPLFVIMGCSMLPFEFKTWILWIIVLDPDTLLTIVSIPYFFKGLRK